MYWKACQRQQDETRLTLKEKRYGCLCINKFNFDDSRTEQYATGIMYTNKLQWCVLKSDWQWRWGDYVSNEVEFEP